MLIDARALPSGSRIESDVCIVGGGAAGIAIARELAGTATKVVLLEAGGLEIDSARQELYEGENLGLPYFPLEVCRLRYLGGSTNHWGGHCMPFRESEFAAVDYIPYSGWPIGVGDVAPWWPRAAEMLGLPSQGWDPGYWADRVGKPPLALDPDVIRTEFHLVKKAFLGELYRPVLEEAANLEVYLNANVVEFEVDESASHVVEVRARVLDGPIFHVAARRFVLAAGGIENARLLLLSDSVQKGGLGNGHDLVGRFFAEHPTLHAGSIAVAHSGVPVGLYYRQWLDDIRLFAHLSLADTAMRRERIAPVAWEAIPVPDAGYTSDGFRSMVELARGVRHLRVPNDLGDHVANIAGDLGSLAGLAYDTVRLGQVPIARVDLLAATVPVPNPDSRVLLGEERDALGLRRVQLDWRMSPLDKRSVRRATELLGAEIARIGLGRLQLAIDDDDQGWPADLEGANHHVCTTRMADDPARGVVDRNCKVFGVDNLYIAGSSVFSTSGLGTPTFMLITLALRLADHLKELPA